MTGDTDSVWVDSMPESYDRRLVPAVFRPFAVELAGRVAARSPGRVLELAAGTGVLTHELVAASVEVTATDLNAAMVDLGGRRVPDARWRRADATDLPFDDDRFDVVTCQFGVMFFLDKQAAFAEIRRVLTPQGTMLMNTWDTLDTHTFQAALVTALARIFPADPPPFMASVPHGYADVDVIATDLRASGLRCTAIDTVALESHAASAADLAVGYCTGTPLRSEIEQRGDLDVVTGLVTREMEALLGAGAVSGTMSAHLIEATPA